MKILTVIMDTVEVAKIPCLATLDRPWLAHLIKTGRAPQGLPKPAQT